MKFKVITGLVLTLFLTSMLTLTLSLTSVGAESGTIYVRADGSIDPPGAPISSVDNVTYTFTGNIYDSIIVERDNIVVDGAGYTVQGTGAYPSKGIDLSGRSNVTIKNMEIKVFYFGIWLYRSSNNSISGNTITNNDYCGILILESSNNVLRSNTMANNKCNFGVWGAILPHFVNDVDVSNTVDGKPIYYWVNERDKVVPLNAGYVALVNCTRITVQNLNLTTNRQGVLLAYTTNSTITKNSITNNINCGIMLDWSSNNSISGNNIRANSGEGIMLYTSSNYNTIVGNSITNNIEPGIELFGSSNYNTITGNNITNNSRGVGLFKSSNYNTITGNNIKNNYYGIWVEYSNYNNITVNNITNNDSGISLEYYSNYNNIAGNSITNNGDGISLYYSSNNSIFGNNVTANNRYGVYFHFATSSNNRFYHNNFIGNKKHVGFAVSSYGNIWDDGYPSGGNYWSGHVCTGNPSNGSQPYVIDANNIDHYPFQDPDGWLAPKASFTYPPHYLFVNQTITFNASMSTPKRGEIASYEWNFGDGTPLVKETDPITTHRYKAVGFYTITLKVTDTYRKWSTTSKLVYVGSPVGGNIAPINKLELLIPNIGMISVILVTIAAVVKKRKLNHIKG